MAHFTAVGVKFPPSLIASLIFLLDQRDRIGVSPESCPLTFSGIGRNLEIESKKLPSVIYNYPTSTMSKNKFFELELLRVTGIFLVLYDHSSPYLGWDPRPYSFIEQPGSVGIGIFFILSGFLLQRSRSLQGTDFIWVSFLKKRLTRIFPLYWISLVVFIIYFKYFAVLLASRFEPLFPTFLAHFLGLQLFSRPLIAEIFTLWYIGALVPYYVLFSLTTKFKFPKYLSLNLIVLVSFFLLKLALQSGGIDFLDVRLFLHYPTFLLGTVVAYLDQDLAFCKTKSLVFTLISGLAAISYVPIIGNEYISIGNRITLSWESMGYYGYSLIWTFFLVSLIFLMAPLFSKSPGIIRFLSLISYAMYLFHRPIYGIFYEFVISFISTSIYLRTLLFPVATLVLIGLSYYLTRLDSEVLSKKFTKWADQLF